MRKKVNKFKGVLILAILSIVFIIGFLIIKGTKNNEANGSYTDVNNDKKQSIIAKSFEHPHGEYFPQNKLTATTILYNSAKEEKEVWIQLKVKNKEGYLMYSNVEKELIISEEEVTHPLSWIIPQNLKSGSYKTEVIVWNNDPGKPETLKIHKV